MQEIVSKVLEAEQQAEAIVREAGSKAAQIRREAEAEAEGALGQAREQAQDLVRQALEEARGQAALERRQAEEEAERHRERFLAERREAIEEAAEAVAFLLVTPEHARTRVGPSGSPLPGGGVRQGPSAESAPAGT